MSSAPTRLRSLLFAPASRPDVLLKLPRSGPDGVVLDLEDAVPDDGKVDARRHAREVGEQLAQEHPHLLVYVRVNPVRSEWFAADVADAVPPSIAGIVIPKLDAFDQLDTAVDALAAAGLTDLSVVAGIETARGVMNIDSLLHPPVTVAYFGAEDFVADMGGVRTESNVEVLYARSRVALSARLAGVHALDQIVSVLDDEGRFLRDAREGRAIGFGGKLCIHPGQVRLANSVFSPSPEEIAHAHRLIAAHDEARGRGEAAVAFEGQMIDEPMVRRARDVLSAAEAADPD